MNANQLRNQFFNAIEKGNVNTVRNLLNNGANINRTDPWHRTPLGRAIAMGHVNVVRLLLQKGAKVNRNTIGLFGNNNNSIATNRELKNIIARALGRRVRHRSMVASLREGMRRRRRAATTIQRHVRGTQLRARAGWNNPYTSVGYLALMKRVKRGINSNKK
jgi:ankyrin repeat protein